MGEDSLHYMPFNTSEFFGSNLVQGMTPEEQMHYIWLLVKYWNGRCQGLELPKLFPKRSRNRPKSCPKITQRVVSMGFFRETVDGREVWHNKYARDLWEKCCEKKRRQSEGGRRGGLSKGSLRHPQASYEGEYEGKEEKKKIIIKKESYDNVREISKRVQKHYQAVVYSKHPQQPDQTRTQALATLDWRIQDGFSEEQLTLAADRYTLEVSKGGYHVGCRNFYTTEFENYLAPDWEPPEKRSSGLELLEKIRKEQKGEP